MTDTLAPPISTAVLLVALEPAAPKGRIQTALVLLGQRADALTEAGARGLTRAVGDRVEVVDARVARLVTHAATERERRLAHLALACARARRTMGYDARAVFDSLSNALDGTVPLLPVEPTERGQAASPGRLTRREHEVAELAASGLPTREIAVASYLSQKTVEYHLTRVYRKLGVRSKSELVFALAGGPGAVAP